MIKCNSLTRSYVSRYDAMLKRRQMCDTVDVDGTNEIAQKKSTRVKQQRRGKKERNGMKIYDMHTAHEAHDQQISECEK